MKKPVLIIILLIGLTVALSVTKAVTHNRLSVSGVFVADIEEQISFYKTQNAILSEELLTSSSLTNIASEATKLGFVKQNASYLVLKTSRPLAVKQ